MRKPLCPYFGICGGCAEQDIEYLQQLEYKKKNVRNATKFDDVKVFSGEEYFYRNRMDFVFHSDGLGLRVKGDWSKVVDVEKCVISDKKLNELLNEIRKEFKGVDTFDLRGKTGTYRYAVIRTASDDSSVSFVLNKDSSKIKEADDKIKEFAKTSNAKNILITFVPHHSDLSTSDDFTVVKGSDELHETYLGKKFSYSIQGFFQNNHAMAVKMQEYVHGLLKNYKTKDSHLLDLYGGVGTFGVVNSDLFKSVTIIESVKSCIDSADKNIKNNKIENAKAIVLDAKDLRKTKLESPLFVITDPPRSGMDESTIRHLNILTPESIIYISCNVNQLSKDLPKFKDYKIKSAAMFDLFPQTPHIEAVIELVLK